MTRTETLSEANLILEACQVTFKEVDLALPNGKRRRLNYSATDSPQVSVLVNPKAIRKHTMLVALEDKAVRAAQEKDKADLVKSKEQEKPKR